MYKRIVSSVNQPTVWWMFWRVCLCVISVLFACKNILIEKPIIWLVWSSCLTSLLFGSFTLSLTYTQIRDLLVLLIEKGVALASDLFDLTVFFPEIRNGIAVQDRIEPEIRTQQWHVAETKCYFSIKLDSEINIHFNSYPNTAANVFRQLCRCMKWSGSFQGLLQVKWEVKIYF